MREALEWERERRRGRHDRREHRQNGAASPPGKLPPAAVQILKVGFRHVSLANHPDRGGTNDGMRAVLEAWAWLRQTFKELR
jgi:hypothetical protein